MTYQNLDLEAQRERDEIDSQVGRYLLCVALGLFTAGVAAVGITAMVWLGAHHGAWLALGWELFLLLLPVAVLLSKFVNLLRNEPSPVNVANLYKTSGCMILWTLGLALLVCWLHYLAGTQPWTLLGPQRYFFWTAACCLGVGAACHLIVGSRDLIFRAQQ